jgi:hypothetical protein
MLKSGLQNGMVRNSMQLSRDQNARVSAGASRTSQSWRLLVQSQRHSPATPPLVKPSTHAIGAASPSTAAIGGRPGRGLVACGPGYPLPPDQFAASPYGQWIAKTETMFAHLAARNDAQERRIAALEKLALDRERGTAALNAAAWRRAWGTRIVGRRANLDCAQTCRPRKPRCLCWPQPFDGP